MRVGYNIKKRREEEVWSQKKLADKVGVQRSQISKWERGKVNPSDKSVACVARMFGITPEELRYGDPPTVEAVLEKTIAALQECSDALSELKAARRALSEPPPTTPLDELDGGCPIMPTGSSGIG